ncbi:hypothetical protein DPEC_G00376220 [Dallia pectoralis]|nr:hypothetical protein DPEC_G00376220 [Dallia pectoralis]
MARTSLPALLLYGLSLVPVLVFQSPTIVVLRGENITLQCSNVSTVVGHVAWFKQVNRSEPVCLSAMYGHQSKFHQYYEKRHFQMFSNNTNIFLELKKLEIADSGLYFCGFFTNTQYMIFFNATFLNVQEARTVVTNPASEITIALPTSTWFNINEEVPESTTKRDCHVNTNDVGADDGTMNLFPLVVIMGGVTAVLLVVIMILVLKIRRGTKSDFKAQLQQLNSQKNTDQDRDSLIYSALSFSQKRPRNNQSADEEQLSDKEDYVVYSVPR